MSFVLGDAYLSDLPRGSFDLADTRLLLINLTDPQSALVELVALVRPGGSVVVQDIDQIPWLCEPPHPAWDALVNAFLVVWRNNGHDPLVGHRLPALLRAAGLVEVEIEVHGRLEPPGAYHRKVLLALIAAVHDEVVRQKLFTEPELVTPTGAPERHLDAPDTLVTRPLLYQAWAASRPNPSADLRLQRKHIIGVSPNSRRLPALLRAAESPIPLIRATGEGVTKRRISGEGAWRYYGVPSD